jgi:hypothetical protein
MAVLDTTASGSPGRISFAPLPGAAAAAAAAAAAPEGGEGDLRAQLASQLVPAAALALGVALTAAPSAVLGSLIGTGGESVVGALLETLVYGGPPGRGARGG